MSEKVSLTSEQIAPIVHDAFADLAKNINERGAPALAIAGELLKLGAEWAIQEEGKVAAEQNVRNLLDQYFAAITEELEMEIRSKGGHARPLSRRVRHADWHECRTAREAESVFDPSMWAGATFAFNAARPPMCSRQGAELLRANGAGSGWRPRLSRQSALRIVSRSAPHWSAMPHTHLTARKTSLRSYGPSSREVSSRQTFSQQSNNGRLAALARTHAMLADRA
jgi:hypothetical protein